LLKKEFIIILIITGAEEENIMAEMKIAIAEDNRQALEIYWKVIRRFRWSEKRKTEPMPII
jgi:hypothetical protein